ncbi:MAG: hypothetical protein A4S08_07210 [Proteobacteria bacterium SG_bin4]|nr:MAG: hypothetical protein A4S08_07210 [Proteobacteria bacterium SG_bin4]
MIAVESLESLDKITVFWIWLKNYCDFTVIFITIPLAGKRLKFLFLISRLTAFFDLIFLEVFQNE